MHQHAMRAADGLDHAVHAEEAARLLDEAQPRLPQRGDDEGADGQRREARRIAPLQQHQADECHQHDLQRHPKAASVSGSRRCKEATASGTTASAGETRHRKSRNEPLQRARKREQRGGDQDRVFVGVVEQMRREQAGEDAADHPAERGPEIELGEQRRRRTARVDFAMTRERQRKQRKQVERHRGKPVFAVAAEQRDGKRRHHKRHDLDDEVVREPRPLAEHRHESEQIERERQHPEQGRGGDVGRDVGGHRDDEAGRNGGECRPDGTVAPCRALHGRRAED